MTEAHGHTQNHPYHLVAPSPWPLVGALGAGYIVRELARRPSSYRSQGSLQDYLAEHKIPGIEGIDTRALVRRVRINGAMPAVLSTTGGDLDDESLRAKARKTPGMAGLDLVKRVTCNESHAWTEGEPEEFAGAGVRPGPTHRVAAIDCGIKRSIGRLLVEEGFAVRIFPATASADEIREFAPDGLFLSNGPGDPEPVEYVTRTIRELVEEIPTFGICLGHQLLARAFGARTYKLKFGHRGGNQPVKDLATSRVEITSQNHGFAVMAEDLEKNGMELTHRNLNDGTVEGFRHKRLPAFAVQYHPEASPGPHDSRHLFGRFRELIESHKS